MSDGATIRVLHELIAALDRRLPQVQRISEAAIARDAAALKSRALERLAELEGSPVIVERELTVVLKDEVAGLEH